MEAAKNTANKAAESVSQAGQSVTESVKGSVQGSKSEGEQKAAKHDPSATGTVSHGTEALKAGAQEQAHKTESSAHKNAA